NAPQRDGRFDICSGGRQTAHFAFTALYAVDLRTRIPRTSSSRSEDQASLKMTGKPVSYTLDSTLESVNTVEQIADRFAVESGFDEEERHRIAMAVREAAVNAVLHGNAYDPTKKVTV